MLKKYRYKDAVNNILYMIYSNISPAGSTYENYIFIKHIELDRKDLKDL